jgi:hypothetical protein
MTTTSPSWFPSWPAGFPDLQAGYEQNVPRQYPEGLYTEGTDEYLDLLAEARILSWVRQGGEWILRRFFPHYDSLGQFLSFWEDVLRLVPAATIALRQNTIISHVRYNLGTAIKANIQAIFAPIFGVEDPARIGFSFASTASIIAFAPETDEAWAQLLNTLHIYDVNETAEPDRTRALDAIRAKKPTWQTWTVGQYQDLKWTTQGGWSTACWV